MCMGSHLGVKIQKPKKLGSLIEYFFGEDQGRYLLEIDKKNLDKVKKILKNSNIYYESIGSTQKNHFEIVDEIKCNIKDLYEINNKWYNNY